MCEIYKYILGVCTLILLWASGLAQSKEEIEDWFRTKVLPCWFKGIVQNSLYIGMY